MVCENEEYYMDIDSKSVTPVTYTVTVPKQNRYNIFVKIYIFVSKIIPAATEIINGAWRSYKKLNL